ncbi:hypothetical protein D3C76_657210 [compost metagenome]
MPALLSPRVVRLPPVTLAAPLLCEYTAAARSPLVVTVTSLVLNWPPDCTSRPAALLPVVVTLELLTLVWPPFCSRPVPTLSMVTPSSVALLPEPHRSSCTPPPLPPLRTWVLLMSKLMPCTVMAALPALTLKLAPSRPLTGLPLHGVYTCGVSKSWANSGVLIAAVTSSASRLCRCGGRIVGVPGVRVLLCDFMIFTSRGRFDAWILLGIAPGEDRKAFSFLWESSYAKLARRAKCSRFERGTQKPREAP